jgi:nitrite reductase/ring-hydroxylating ferredoxin subunit
MTENERTWSVTEQAFSGNAAAITALAQPPRSPGQIEPIAEISLRDVRRNLFARILDYMDQGKTALADQVMFLDIEAYRNPDFFEQEFRQLFLESPQVACLSTDIPQPGNFRTFDDLGVPIVVTRGRDGKVRAFLNICPHRGSRLVREEYGKSMRMTCRFHGWTFDTRGEAIGIPEEQMFCGQIQNRKSLASFPCEERHGLVFIQATAGSAMDLDGHLGAFDRELELLNLTEAHRVDEFNVRSVSNWKYALDTYFENYHLPVLHRESFAKIFASGLCLFDTWGPHHRFTFPHLDVRNYIGKPEEEWPVNSLPITYFMFPNTILSVGSVSKIGGSLTLNRLFPPTVGENVTRIVACAQNGVPGPEHVAEIEKSLKLIRGAVIDEDYSVTGEAYPSLGALPKGWEFVYGRHEIGVQNLHKNFAKATGLYQPRFEDPEN